MADENGYEGPNHDWNANPFAIKGAIEEAKKRKKKLEDMLKKATGQDKYESK